jgi:tRNA(adenine34) deaminase
VAPTPAVTPAETDDSAYDRLMVQALAAARAAPAHDDVPVGAIVARRDAARVLQPIATRHNERELTGDPTAHAEILALRDAAEVAGTWRLDGFVLVATCEPCPMCAGAAWAARVGTIVFGAPDPKAGATGSLYNLAADPRLNHEMFVVPSVREAECAALLREFFGARRA